MRDLDIRLKLKESFLKKYYLDSHSRVIEEFDVCYGSARADIAVINGHLHGYEIKSESDNLLRLPNQLKFYSKTFDYLTIVTGKSHFDGVLTKVPEWCGIIVASQKQVNGIKLKIFRRSKKNRNIDKLSLAQLLWKQETIETLNQLGFQKGLASKTKTYLWGLLASNTSQKQLSSLVRDSLATRSNWRVG